MDSEFAQLVAQQRGVFRREQALAWYSPSAINQRIVTGAWIVLFRGVFGLPGVERDSRSWMRAALLAADDSLVVGLRSAAALHGFGILPTADIQLVGPRAPAVVQPGLQIQVAAISGADIACVQGIKCTHAARTAIDLVRRSSAMDALAVADAALRRGVSAISMEQELRRHRALPGVVQARRILGLADGRAESAMASRLRSRILDSGLPSPEVQVLVGSWPVQLAWPGRRVGAEYAGETAQRRLIMQRHAALVGQGWQIFTFTDVDIYHRPEQLVATLAAALERAAA